jgi:hypothetical protein
VKKHREGWGCVYSAINRSKDLEYIGKDKTGDPINHRWKRHCNESLRNNPRSYFSRGLKNAGGFTGFRWSVVWRGPVEELYAKEIYYIAKRHTWVGDPLCRGYNLTKGGEGFQGKHSKKTKRKMSFTRQLPEIKAKMSAAALQYWKNPEAHVMACSVAQRPEVRKKKSSAQQRRWKSPAEHEKMKLIFQRPITKKRMRTSALRRWEDPAEHEKLRSGQRRRFEDPAAHDRVSIANLRSYAENPDRRKKLSASQQRYWLSPKSHEKASAALRKRYEDSAERKKTGDALKCAWAKKTPKDRLAISSKISATKLRRNAVKK